MNLYSSNHFSFGYIYSISTVKMGSHGYNNAHDDLYENSAFTAEMSSKMQVPKRISVLGGKLNLFVIPKIRLHYLKNIPYIRN